MKLIALVVVVTACSSGDDTASTPKPAGSATKRGSGLSASLATEYTKDSPGTPTPTAPETNTGSASASSGSNSGAKVSPPEPPVAAKTIDAGAGPVATASADAGMKATVAPPPPPPPVKLTPELAAIKFELLPNWVRDEVGAATFSLVVNVPKTGDKKTFAFHYGYDVPNAPTDREQYKKLLADQHVLVVSLDRQRGSAWYLEGTDDTGARAFRFVVTYGGKRLVCYGSTYHDAEHDPLGDLRDEVVVQAKKICESLSL